MTSTKDDILAALPGMDQADLKAIHVLVSALVIGAAEAPRQSDDPYSWVFEALKGVTGSPQNKVPKGFSNNATMLLEFVQANFPDALKNRVSGSSVILMLVSLIGEDMFERGVPRTLGTLTLNLSTVARVFDNAFPGYRQANMAHLVFNRP
jgi:hypothetical protein